MKRGFEKISFNQFAKDVVDNEGVYNSYLIPQRKTERSAGYDFMAIDNITIKSKQIVKIPSGIKAKMLDDDYLMLIIRSSLGFKYNIRLVNQVGIIDSDYYNNPDNEGHIWIKLENHGDEDVVIKKGEGIFQGIFQKYLKSDNEKEVKTTRKGGIGSTNTKEV